MGNDVFDGQILAEKFLKLNNSQQSIECIQHCSLFLFLWQLFLLVISALSSCRHFYYGNKTIGAAIGSVHCIQLQQHCTVVSWDIEMSRETQPISSFFTLYFLHFVHRLPSQHLASFHFFVKKVNFMCLFLENV